MRQGWPTAGVVLRSGGTKEGSRSDKKSPRSLAGAERLSEDFGPGLGSGAAGRSVPQTQPTVGEVSQAVVPRIGPERLAVIELATS